MLNSKIHHKSIEVILETYNAKSILTFIMDFEYWHGQSTASKAKMGDSYV